MKKRIVEKGFQNYYDDQYMKQRISNQIA
jgi:hypothetical protein